MIEVIVAIILTVSNLILLVEVSRRLSLKNLEQEIPQIIIESGVLDSFSQSLVGHGMEAANEIWNDGGREFIQGLSENFLLRMKNSVLGQMGGIVSGQTKQEKILVGAASKDILNSQSPLLAIIAKQFPSVMELIEENPELLQHVPALIKRLNLEGLVSQFTGDSSKQPSRFF